MLIAHVCNFIIHCQLEMSFLLISDRLYLTQGCGRGRIFVLSTKNSLFNKSSGANFVVDFKSPLFRVSEYTEEFQP